ncbi:MAG TPA: VWA domain-containing protein [Solirubrobacteraceae bacterium]|jgi:Ca-activated chloride channel family protein|nr:VWA domain-containing protein [Solirubrobacteraceae bacterium]
MNFAHPDWLFALLAVPALILLAISARSRARTYAVRFPALASLREAAAAAPRWQRLVPEALLLAAVTVALAAAAGPQHSRTVTVGGRAAVMLVTDHSGSMESTDVAPTRLGAAVSAATTFVDKLPSSADVGIVSFSTVPDTVLPPTTNHSEVVQVLDDEEAEGSTATGNALAVALQLLTSLPGHPPSAIVLYSDGAANAGTSSVAVAQQAARDHIPIDTVALGTPNGTLTVQEFPFGVENVPVPPDPQLMQAIAKASHGESFDAKSEGDLNRIYTHLGKGFAVHHSQTPLASEFGAGAALLLFGAALLAGRRTPRLP